MIPLGRALAKLNIQAFQDREMRKSVGVLQAMYNPKSLSLSYAANYESEECANSKHQRNRFQQIKPGDLTLELIFDAQLPGNKKSVDMQLASLRSLCFAIDGKTGEPHFLQIKWGKMRWNGLGYFSGRVASLSISYTLFDHDATPLRASASLTLTADESLTLQESAHGQHAPESSLLTVPHKSSLPLLAATASASAAIGSSDYLRLAYANDMDNFSAMKAGDTLISEAVNTGGNLLMSGTVLAAHKGGFPHFGKNK